MRLRYFFIVLSLLAVLGLWSLRYGSRVLAGKFTVARYTYRFEEMPPAASSEVARRGLTEAMEHAGLSSNSWEVMSPNSQEVGVDSGQFILSNRVTKAWLYARAEPVPQTNVFNYHIYRHK